MKKTALVLLLTHFLFLLAPAQAATAGEVVELSFPHFAAGQGWKADLALRRQSGARARGTVQFRDKSGKPLRVVVNGQLFTTGLLPFSFEERSATFELTAPANDLAL